jgi:hypothetical protein
MFIRNSDQQRIEVTDLKKAISQAKMSVGVHHSIRDLKRWTRNYSNWKDVLQKLIALKKAQ